MDILSEVLRVVRLTGGVFFTARLAGQWAFRSPPPQELSRVLDIRAESIALFHILVEGRCWLDIDGEVLEVEDRTMIVLPHGHAHLIASRLDLSAHPLGKLLDQCSGQLGVPRVHHGEGGNTCRFVCGYLACDQRFNPLIGALPDLLLVCPGKEWIGISPAQDGKSLAVAREAIGADGALEAILRYTIEEAEGQRPGSPAMLARQAELLYLEILRGYARNLPPGRAGWLAGVEHPEVGQALRLLHRDPRQKWTVAELARAVRLSRSALGQRFAEVVGEPPMRYLAGWRMQLAKSLLRQPGLSIAQVAAQVGYDSDVAFHRAFKRHSGQTPAAWRNSSR
jgi:AraC family transcriptional regulator, alkane utilization regulator